MATKAGIEVQKAVEDPAHCAAHRTSTSDPPVETIDGRGRPTLRARLGRQRRRPHVEWGNALGAPTPVAAAVKVASTARSAGGLGVPTLASFYFAEHQAGVALR